MLSSITTKPLNSYEDAIEISASNIQNGKSSSRYHRVLNGEAEWLELQQFLMHTINDNCSVLVTPDTEQLLRGQYQYHISKHADQLKTVAKSSIEGDIINNANTLKLAIQ